MTTACSRSSGSCDQGALDVSAEPGVPAQLEGSEQVELVAERLVDALDVQGQVTVASVVGGGDHAAEGLSAVAVRGAGHRVFSREVESSHTGGTY